MSLKPYKLKYSLGFLRKAVLPYFHSSANTGYYRMFATVRPKQDPSFVEQSHRTNSSRAHLTARCPYSVSQSWLQSLTGESRESQEESQRLVNQRQSIERLVNLLKQQQELESNGFRDYSSCPRRQEAPRSTKQKRRYRNKDSDKTEQLFPNHEN